MKKIISLLLMLSFTVMFSQTHRFIYELNYKLGGGTQKTNMVLDIDKDFVKFYDYDFLRNDSIRKNTGQNMQTNTLSDQLVLRKINSNENRSFHDHNFDYFAISSVGKMTWNISKETKKIGEYKLQKATAKFGGRNWTAWFSKEIPFQEGPYKFRGLPGLIFEIYDDENNFHYTLAKSQNLTQTFDTSDFLETHFGNKPIAITLEQYHKLKVDHYNNPMASFAQSLKNGGTVMINGEKIGTQEQLDQKRNLMQNLIKKYYNPIELDKAIPYPEK